ncbi:MAG: hypothetical protein NTW25_13325 [Candidatus Kapabacteria bacterium]|nr:hypothetical protein [Candidatus Kapabacteria bacterium]
MNPERINRISFVGLAFFLSLIFFYWIFGGEFVNLNLFNVNDQPFNIGILLTFVSTILLSPIFGYIISTFTVFVLYLLKGIDNSSIQYNLRKNKNQEEILKYSSRRYDIINTNINLLFVILLGFIYNLPLLMNMKLNEFIEYNCIILYYKLISVVIILLFIVVSIFNSYFAYQESKEIEGKFNKSNKYIRYLRRK